MPPSLSIIVPAFNERQRIVSTLKAITDYLDARTGEAQVIVCADGTDGTREQAAELARRDPRIIVMGTDQRRGKGLGVREGMLRATGDIIGFIDADYKTPIDQLDRLLPALSAGADVAIGSRKMDGSQIDVRQPIYRRMGSMAFHAIVHSVLGLNGIHDTQCGFKFFTRAAAHRLFSLQQVNGYMFDVEILRLARRLGYNIAEVPVRWRDDGDSRYAPVSGTIRNARELFRICRLKYPDAA